MIQIILNEWKILLRNRMPAYLTLFFIIGLLCVSALGIIQNNKQQEEQQAARAHIREQWENVDPMHPHYAAHFGTYAFKPQTSLSSIDEGVNSITGNVLRLEAHVQNEAAYSEASQSLSVSKFGKLKPSLLLQYVIPLLLIFLAFASVSNEKESGRLKLLLFQGASLCKIIFAKAIAVWLYGLALLIVTVGMQIVLNSNTIDADSSSRITSLLLAYLVYYYIVTLLSTYFSAILKSKTASLSSMLALWILWTIFLPKIWGNTAEKLYPLPSRQEFKTTLREERKKGIDGHNPSDKRAEAFKQELLEEYKVADIKELPINYDGLMMQADEDYGNIVWDKNFGDNYEILQKQKNFYQFSGIFNPFASLQDAGMGFCGTDMLHYLDFLRQAENYRRELIRSLNAQQAYGGTKTGDWETKVESEFYRSLQDFQYHEPSIKKIGKHYEMDMLLLLLWALASSIIVLFTAKKQN